MAIAWNADYTPGAGPLPFVLTFKATSVAPVNTVAPAVTGDTAGNTLSTDNGTWTGAVSYVYAWLLDDVLIEGETASTIDTLVGWQGQTLKSQVTAHNAVGDTAATSIGTVLL